MNSNNSSRISNADKRGPVFAGIRGLRALILGAAVLMAGGQSAGAVEWYTGDKTSDPDYAPSIVLDVSGSVTNKQSNFAAGAVTAAVEGNMQQTGFRAHAEALGGVYSYYTSIKAVAPAVVDVQRKINAVEENAGVLAGYAWVSRDWTFALYAGMQVMNTTLNYNDPANSSQGLHIGAKIAGEFYGNPTKNTMVSGYGSYSTNANQYYSRFKAGYAAWGNVFIGPEFSALGNQYYAEYRAGVHLTGIKLSSLSLGLSGGVTDNPSTGTGAYGIVDARMGF